MSGRQSYAPGAAAGAEVRMAGERWPPVLVRDLAHPPAKVCTALPDPEHRREWAPCDAGRNLGAVGAARLSTVGAPTTQVSESRVTRADAPRVLEFDWGGQNLRWELEPLAGGSRTRLRLWHDIDRNFVSMGAAGWHICLDVLERELDGQPIGRIVGGEAMKFGWRRLNAEYAEQFGVEAPAWPPRAEG